MTLESATKSYGRNYLTILNFRITTDIWRYVQYFFPLY